MRTSEKFGEPKVVKGVITEIVRGGELLHNQLDLSRKAYNCQIRLNRWLKRRLCQLQIAMCPELVNLGSWFGCDFGYIKEHKDQFVKLRKELTASQPYKEAAKQIYGQQTAHSKQGRAALQSRGLLHSSKDAAMKEGEKRKVSGRTLIPTKFRSYREQRGGLFIERKRAKGKDRPTLQDALTNSWADFQMKPAEYTRHNNSQNNPRRLFQITMKIGQGKQDVVVFKCLFWRLPPITARIAGIKLIQTGEEFGLRLTFEPSANREGWFTKPCNGNGVVAVDLGWRKVTKGVRVALFAGRGLDEVVLPLHYWQQWDMVDHKQSKIDADLNNLRPQLVNLPKHLFPFVGKWKNPGRFASAFRKWRAEGGSGVIFEVMDKWYATFCHDQRHMEGRRSNLIAARDHYYCTFARQLADKYDTLLLDTLNLKALAEKAAGQTCNKARQRAGLSKLVEALEQCGIAVEKPDCAYTSRDCHVCGHRNEASADAEVMCSKCCNIVDRDVRACANLIKTELDLTNWRVHEVKIRSIFGRKSKRMKNLVT